MKNEKMKRVAALALAGTIAVSTVSPAAFADGGENKEIEPIETKEVEQQQTKTQPDTDVNAALEATPAEDSGLPTKEDHVTAVVVNPGYEAEAPGELIETPVTSDTELTVDVNEDGPGLVVTDEQDTPVSNDGVLGVYDVEGALDDVYQQIEEEKGNLNPEDSDYQENLDRLEEAQQEVEQAKEEEPDIVIGDYAPAPRPQEAGDGDEDESFLVNPGVIEDSVTVDREDFDESTVEGDKDAATADGIEESLDEQLGDQLDEDTKVDDVIHNGDIVTAGEKEYYVSDMTSGEWNAVDGNGDVQQREYTFTLTSESDVSVDEDRALAADEIAKILGVTIEGEPVITDGELISFVDTNGNTYTVTKNWGTEVTVPSWQIAVTETKTTHHEEAEVVEDKTEIVEGSLEPEGDTVIMGGDENAELVGESAGLGLTEEQIEAVMNTGSLNGYVVTSDGKGGYTLTQEGSSVSYTITSMTTGNIECSAADLEAKTNEEIKALLGDSYSKGEDGKIYYTVDGKAYEAHFEDGEIGQKLTVTVIKTDAHGAESGVTDLGSVEQATAEAQEQAQQEALLDALNKNAGIATGGWFDEGNDGDLVYTVNGVNYPVTKGENGEWSVTVPEEGKGDVTYTFTIQNKEPVTTNTTDTTDVDGKKEQVADQVEGLEADDIASVTTTTVTGSAVVTEGDRSWSTTEEIKGILQQNGFVIDENTFRGATVEKDETTGQIKSITITSYDCGNTVETVYNFNYSQMTDEELAKWKDELLEGKEDSWKDDPTLGSTDGIQKVTWTIETTTTYKKPQTETVTDGSIKVEKTPDKAYVEDDGKPGKVDVEYATVEDWEESGRDKDLHLVKVEGSNKYYEYDKEWDHGWELDLEDDKDDPVYTITSGELTDQDTIENLLLKSETANGYTSVTFVDGENKAQISDDDGNLLEVQYTATQTTVTKEEKDKIELSDVTDVVNAIKAGEYTVAGYDKTGDEVTMESFKDFLKTQQSDRQAEPQTPETYKHGDNSCNPGFKPEYKPECSPSYTITKVTSKSSTSLTMTVLSKKEINDSACNNGITGSYTVNHKEELKVKNCFGQPEYKGEGTASFDSYQTWLTTEDKYQAQANQYGVVTTGGGAVEEEAKLDFTYTTTEVETSVVSKTEDSYRFVYAELNRTPAPTENPDGPGETPEIPGETPETPDEGGETSDEELPNGGIVEIEDLATALAAGPAAEETDDELTDIGDEDVALSGAPETGDELTDIGDAEVAKSDVPKTGDESGIFLLMSMISGMALAALSFIDRKGRHSRFGSQH